MNTQHIELIEASAGTGKTYTICKAAAELITQHGVGIDQLLMVTFTNKAAGELQDRLRQFLRGICDNQDLPQEQRESASVALANFDAAQISTFHGFCQFAMAKYGFECQLPLNLSIENDPMQAQIMLLKQIREIWIPTAESAVAFRGEMLALVSELSGRLGQVCCSLAVQMQRSDVVKPLAGSALQDMLQRTEREWIEQQIAPLVSLLSEWDGLYEQIVDQFKNTKGFDFELLLVKPLSQLREGVATANADEIEQLVKAAYTSISRRVRASANPMVKQLLDVLKGMKDAISLAGIFNNCVKRSVMAEATRLLSGALRADRQSRGVVNFNDMLQGFADAVSENPELRRVVANQYRAVLVDEFQDTDPLQWRIISQLFLEPDASHTRLYLVGDPKQAIYTFRGANVQTYLAAKRCVQDRGGTLNSLDTNYRSAKPFIDAINELCSDYHLFGEPAEGRLTYTEVEAPSEPGASLIEGWQGRKPIVVMKSDASKHAQSDYLRFIAQEIVSLMTSQPIVQFRGQAPRALRLDDICILCKSHQLTKRVSTRLAAAGIPYNNGRSCNIYQTEEAAQLSLVLRALLTSDDQALVQNALLSRVFALHPYELQQQNRLRDAQQLLQRARETAENERWDRLFRVLYYQTRLFQREAAATDGDRRIANWLQLGQELSGLAHTNHDDLASLVRRLQRNIQQGYDDEGGGQLRREADQPKVQVVTMHASKGLEYGVVFLVMGQRDNSSDYHTVCCEDHTEFLYKSAKEDLSAKDDPDALLARRQFEEEQQRLLYVAMTRSCCRLYLPMLKQNSMVMAKCISKMVDDRTLENVDIRNISDELTANHPILSITPTVSGELVEFRPAPADIHTRLSRIHSFSGLPYHLTARDAALPETDAHTMAQMWSHPSASTDELLFTHTDDDNTPAMDEVALPTGPECGNLFHAVLQSVDYEMVDNCRDYSELLAQPSFKQLVDDALPASGLPFVLGEEPLWLPQFAERIWCALNVECPLIGRPLSSLPNAKRQAELPFHHKLPIASVAADELTGIIDLVFEHEGKIYIIDWKSNHSPTGYEADTLEEMMEHGGYHGQYRTYILALWRLYEAWGIADFWQRFGGVCYVFLRGVDASTNNGFYVRKDITQQEVEHYEQLLHRYTQVLKQGGS